MVERAPSTVNIGNVNRNVGWLLINDIMRMCNHTMLRPLSMVSMICASYPCPRKRSNRKKWKWLRAHVCRKSMDIDKDTDTHRLTTKHLGNFVPILHGIVCMYWVVMRPNFPLSFRHDPRAPYPNDPSYITTLSLYHFPPSAVVNLHLPTLAVRSSDRTLEEYLLRSTTK